MATRPWLTDEQQRVWRAYLEMNEALSDRIDRELRRRAGMPLAYYLVLAMLSEAPGRSLRMSELAAAAWASPSRMTHAVDRLESEGWVERRPAPGDRRGQVATLTDSGHARLVEVAPAHAQTVRNLMFDSLTPDQLRAFGEICDATLAQLKSM